MPTPQWMAQVIGGRVHQPDPVRVITGFSIDSRNLKQGEFFIALAGEHTDGHLFIEEAFRRGASGALVSRLPHPTNENLCNCVQVSDTRQALQQLAAAYRQEFHIPIVGITGSSGKTTTKELLYAILSQKFRAYRSPGNYNTEIGLPVALLNMPPDVEVGIFELALQRPDEIKTLSEIARPTIGVLTSIGDAHLGFFRDQEALARAKWELVENLPRQGVAVLNFDAPYLASWAQRLTLKVIGFGIENPRAQLRAARIQDDQLAGVALEIHTSKEKFCVQTKLLGRANVYNILAAVAVALERRVAISDIQKALEKFVPVPHRMELKRCPRLGFILDDSYNANPSSTREALQALARLRLPYRKIFVFGDMLELGDSSIELHRELADVIDGLNIDRVFTVGELAEETARALSKRANWGAKRVMSAQSVEELKEQLLRELRDDQNLILIKGSRGMELDRLVEALL